MAKAGKKSSARGRGGSSRPVYDPFDWSSPDNAYLSRIFWLYKLRFSESYRGRPPPPPDAGVAREIAALARAPDVNRLCKAVSYAIDDELWWHREGHKQEAISHSPGWEKRAKIGLKRARRLSLDLYECLNGLEPIAAFLLTKLALSEPPVWDDVVGGDDFSNNFGNDIDESNFFATLKTVVGALAEASSRTTFRLQQGPAKLAWPKWALYFGPGSFERFTLYLLWDVKASGGRLTLDKNNQTGTLVEALERLRPHLPPNFIPNRLPISQLVLIKALDKRIPFDEGWDRELSVQ